MIWFCCSPTGNHWLVRAMEGGDSVTGSISRCPWDAAARAARFMLYRLGVEL